jgi:hypothetical protein
MAPVDYANAAGALRYQYATADGNQAIARALSERATTNDEASVAPSPSTHGRRTLPEREPGTLERP